MNGSIPLGRVLGVRISAHWSVLLIAALLVWALAGGLLPTQVPEASEAARLVAAVITVGAFFASLLAHELAHAVVARRHGLTVHGITLWVLGGVSHLGDDHPTPEVELRVAVVGPLTSLAIAAVTGLAWFLLAATDLVLVREVTRWLALVNAVLGVFNLAPAFPLDGGRVLRAWAWRRTGDRVRATRQAVATGRAIGQAMIALGLLQVLLLGRLDGLWFALIGWFLTQAGPAEEARVVAGGLLREVRVADVMTRHPVVAPDWMTVERCIEAVVTPSGVSAYPLVDLDGGVTGLVTLRTLASVPGDERGSTRLRDVGVPRDRVPTARPDDHLLDVVARTGTAPGTRILVFDDDGALVGIVSGSDVTRAMEIALLQGEQPTAEPQPVDAPA